MPYPSLVVCRPDPPVSDCRLAERDPALPAVARILVLHRIHQPTDEVQAESPAGALSIGRLMSASGALRDIESLDIIIGQRHFDAARRRGIIAMRMNASPAGAVLDHVREELLEDQIHRGQKAGVDRVSGEEFGAEREDALERIEAAPERAFGRPRCGLALHQHNRDVVFLRRAAQRTLPRRASRSRRQLGHRQRGAATAGWPRRVPPRISSLSRSWYS